MKYKKDEYNIIEKENLVKYERKILDEILNSKDVEMTEISYCCYGLNRPCWYEYVAEGNWEFDIEDVKNNIKRNIKRISNFLYREPRLFIKGEDYFFYARDKIGKDFIISIKSRN